MHSVSIDPETGFDIITWYSIDTSTYPYADNYKIAIAYKPNPNDPGIVYVPIGTTDVTVTMYSNKDLESSLHPVGYAVWAYDNNNSGTPGDISSPDSTIYLEADFDSCLANITLTWNDYNTWRGSIAGYNITRRLGPGIYVVLETFPEGSKINTAVLTNLGVNQHYDLFVEAVHTDGRKSTSNRIDVITQMSQQPDYINADYATIATGNAIDVSFTIDGSSDLTKYNLMRSNSPGGPFVQIASFNTPETHITYTDETSFTSAIYYFRLDVMNNCGQSAAESNLGNNIILKGSLTNGNVSLWWNEYLFWSGGVEQYQVIRTTGRVNPVTDLLSGGVSTNFNDDISTLSNYDDPASSLICYEVKATENTNIYGIQGISLSNKVCFTVNPDIRMPNAFIPNDTEPVNQVFEPVFSFMPEHYDMIIYNRLGTKIWEGSQAWDGKVNGRVVPEGVYVYYLRVYNYSTNIIELNGKVTVVYR